MIYHLEHGFIARQGTPRQIQETFVSCSTFRVGIRVVSNRVVFRVVVLLFVLWVSCCSFCAYLEAGIT